MTPETYIKSTGKQDLNTQMNDIWRAWQKQKLLSGRNYDLPYATARQLYNKLKADYLKEEGSRLIKVGHKEYVFSRYELDAIEEE